MTRFARAVRPPQVLVVVVCTVMLLASLVDGAARAASPPGPAAKSDDDVAETVRVDGADQGRRFDGVGALSAGASSRLLYDYPRRQRSQILDYLFEPGYGASLQQLKVEIGGGVNSTSGSEASHEPEPGEVECGRGYEWWLMKQAKKRNPDIEIGALAWGSPGWTGADDGTPDGGFYSQQTIDYYLTWLKCADRHGLRIDYLGGWNERGYDTGWYVDLARRLERDYPHIRIVAADDCCSEKLWRVADSMAADRAFKEAVDIVGVHFACGHRTRYQDCESTQTARELGEPLWMSENAAGSRDVGAGPIARALNRMYIDADMTSYTSWSLISAWYANLPIADSGLMVAEWPWSGHYDVGRSIWANAHTTQFTEPGWHYLRTGSERLDSGATAVSLASPDGNDFSTIVEAMDAEEPTTIEFDLRNLPERDLQLWSSDLEHGSRSDLFNHDGSVAPTDGTYRLKIEPGHVYSISTRTDAGKGEAAPDGSIHERMDLPYREDFERSFEGHDLARYFSDVNGDFETAPCGAGRPGSCYRQRSTRQPVVWNDLGFVPPTTVVGDPRWWGDYTVRAKVLLEGAEQVELVGRVSTQVTGQENVVGGYHLRVGTDGWSLASVDPSSGERTVLASGSEKLEPGGWHRLALRMRGQRIQAELDGQRLVRVRDASQTQGNVALQVGSFDLAQFDDVRVDRTAPAPKVVSKRALSASASSDHGFDGGDSLRVSNVVDDRPETFWHSEFDPQAPPPHVLTLDLGRRRHVEGMLVRPRIDGEIKSMIDQYRVRVSNDGETYRTVADGRWPQTASTKVVRFSRRTARYVRLVVPAGRCAGTLASAAEVDVVTRAGASLTPTPPPVEDDTDPRFEHVVPQSEMTATASSSYGAGYEPCHAVDGNDATFWHSAPASTGPLPATLTLDLGATYDVSGLGYLNRQDGNSNGAITRYRVSVSADGQSYDRISEGSWDTESTRHYATWAKSGARYVRIEAVDGVSAVAAAADIVVGYVPD